MSLLEVVVALALLSIAMLGAVGVVAQARVVPSLTQREAAAVRIASDMAARIALNPAGFRQGLYDAPLQSLDGSAASTMAPGDACASLACNASQRAAADRAELAASLAKSLPGATLRLQRNAAAGAATASVLIEWPMPRHAWMAAAEGNGCAKALQCLRLDIAP